MTTEGQRREAWEQDRGREIRIAGARDNLITARKRLDALLMEFCGGCHEPVQHRDGRPPWCRWCGRTNEGVMVTPPGSPDPDRKVRVFNRLGQEVGVALATETGNLLAAGYLVNDDYVTVARHAEHAAQLRLDEGTLPPESMR